MSSQKINGLVVQWFNGLVVQGLNERRTFLSQEPIPEILFRRGAGVAQLVSARPSELEVPGSILGDSNVCFEFLLICVALALNTRKTEH